jgi:Chemoreceptor zinc-binding domain
MAMKNEIESALHAHALWRERFNDILNGRATFDLEKISATNQCVFGHWLDNEAHRMMPTQVRDEICLVHKEFHQIAADIIQKIKEKRYAEAKNDISLDGALNQKSLQLRSLLVKLSFSEPAGANSALQQETETAGEPGAEETLAPPADEIHLPDTTI